MELNKENVKIEGYKGRWSMIDVTWWRGRKVYLMEHTTYGDESQSLIINSSNKVIMNDVWNGFDDLENL